MLQWGTSYFVSRKSAESYYGQTHGDPKATVARKLKEGEIHIGVPHLKVGEKLIRIDNGTRYAIRSEE